MKILNIETQIINIVKFLLIIAVTDFMIKGSPRMIINWSYVKQFFSVQYFFNAFYKCFTAQKNEVPR